LLLPLTAIGAKLDEDGYQMFKAAVRRLLTTRTSPAGPERPIVLQDPRTGLQVVLEPDLPD